jgi:sulfite reductase (NADPH) hemoprotein beta-component
MAENNENLSSTERIKMASDALRGTFVESLANEITGSIYEDDYALVRFHGMYVQDDRDRREERAAKKLERLYSFMIRLRLTGGVITPEQYITLHNIAGENSTGVLKITTRQTIQLHGVLKSKVKPTLKAFNQAGLTTLATCGDVNRNVLCSSHPKQSHSMQRSMIMQERSLHACCQKQMLTMKFGWMVKSCWIKHWKLTPCIKTVTCRVSLKWALSFRRIMILMYWEMILV